jgi:hypothetical protein
MKKLLITAALVAATFTPAKSADLEGLLGGAAYLTVYAGNCGTLPYKTKKAVETIILEMPDEVMVKAMKFDRQRQELGNVLFCAMMRKNFADML